MASFKKDKEDLYQTVFTELKILGVKVPKVKKFRTNASKQKSALCEKECKIFGVSLSEQEWVSHGENSLPKFLLMATTHLQNFTDKEGLFRKAGNVSRQRKLRVKLEKGEGLQDSDPNDVACLLKQWLRELPEPLIPYCFQNLFIRCQNLDTEKDCVSACLLTCLLLPPDHQHCLRHLLHFLADVALNSKKSRMSTYNLSLIMAPNIFATNESIGKVSSYTNNLVYQHTAVMKILIENSDKVGKLPASVFLQQSLHRPKSTASLDALNVFPSATKAKRKLRNDIISGFRKLVGQTGASVAEKNPGSEESLMDTSLPRQAISVDDLDDASSSETPNFRDVFTTPENTSSRHIRRKSFGTLLRRKDKKRTDDLQKLKWNIFDEKIKKGKESKDKVKMCKSQDPIDTKVTFSNLLNNCVSSASEINLSSRRLTDLKQSDSQLPVINDDFSKLSVDETSKLPIDNGSTDSFSEPNLLPSTIVKDNRQVMAPLQKTDTPKQEMIKVKQPSKSLTNSVTHVKKVKSKGVISACSQVQKSICNKRCDKNKAVIIENILPEKKLNEKSLLIDESNFITMNHTPYTEFPEENRPSSKQPSPINLQTNDQSTPKSKQVDISSSETSAPQSVDLSLNLLFQNFCLSPPSDSKEITLSIGISSDKSNPELKVNIRQRDISPNQTTSGKSCQVPENKTSGKKSRKRLSSNSDSRIPRLRKYSCQRPKSFSGNQLDCKLVFQKPARHNDYSNSHCTKIPVMCIKSEPVRLPMQEENVNSCFKTPDSSFGNSDSVTHIDGSHYLSAIGSPEEITYNKRESIARILKENTGHVKEKVNLYDSKLQSQSSSCSSVTKSDSENCKLLRTSSDKYCPRYSNTTDLYSSNNYDSARRGGSLRNKSFKSTRKTPPKFALTDMETPSPILKQIEE